MDTVKLVQDFLYTVPIFPYLWFPHCIMMSLAARQVYGGNALNYARSNPLSCFLRTLLYTFPGGILSALFLAEPAFALMANLPTLSVMIIAWYLTFFSPRDFFAQFILKTKLTFLFSITQDFMRLHLCLSGVAIVAKTYPKAFVYMTFIGICKSSGFMVFKYIEHLFDKGLQKADPFKIPNHPTKTCILASMAFAVQASGVYDFGGDAVVLAGLTLLAVNLRLFFTSDPYYWFEAMVCGVLFGGVSPPLDKASKKV